LGGRGGLAGPWYLLGCCRCPPLLMGRPLSKEERIARTLQEGNGDHHSTRLLLQRLPPLSTTTPPPPLPRRPQA
jgi:hypothetical protein